MTENNGQTDLDAVLERISPEHREAFLRSRLRLKKFQEDDEVLAIATHLENFAVVIGDLSSNVMPRSETSQEMESTRREVKELTEAVKALKTDLGSIHLSTDVLRGIAKHHVYWMLGLAFAAGALAWPVFDLTIGYLRGLGHTP